MLSDASAREQAINPKLSLIVQAPAGSGKTELLTQRFLNLLATVDAPEQVVALTFTRKAAHEMQARILSKLPLHEAAKKRDTALDWQLLKNPNRLRVTTLDSLCQSITRAIPLQEKHVPYTTVTDTPNQLYWQAARACVEDALKTPDYAPAITTLLKHLDNRMAHLLTLLTEQLAKRDQWLAPVYQARLQNKTHLEAALKHITSHAIQQFKKVLPLSEVGALITLARTITQIEAETTTTERTPLTDWHHLDELNAEKARALGALLLTSQKKLRKALDHHVGLKRDSTTPERYQALKAESKALLEVLDEKPGFLEALLRVHALPEPTYPEAAWEPLQALLTLLPLLAAHLQLAFQATQSTDFTAVTHQALDALGAEDAPTDLALYLDYNIQHLLIDEFQDTSLQQFELITKLVRGFEPGDGRTVFVVGDPMQSIYRFRAAEVGLFLRAQQEGIGHIQLKPVYLDSNFRSNAPLIEWINQYFAHIFPAQDDLASGAVSFHPAVPTKPADNTRIEAFHYEDKTAEAKAIADFSATTLAAYPDESIAILVRSRTQLPPIISALEAKGIPYQGLDTELTKNLSHVKDVWSLTKALLMPTCRLSWLALLRSPLCGLGLSDLHLIANHSPKASIPAALSARTCTEQLSQSGQLRVRYVFHVLQQALACRHQLPLIPWVLHTLKALHFDAIFSADCREDLNAFWDKLAQFEKDGLLEEIELFESSLNGLYSQKSASAPLQLMTIHKSKGLEFDTVILPGLGRRAPAQDKPLLRWLTLPTHTTEDLILISPLNASDAKAEPLYDYLGTLDAEKNNYEQQRLLYVGITRAKKRLYLLDSAEKILKNTFRESLRAYPFAAIEGTQKAIAPDTLLPQVDYLPDSFYEKAPPQFQKINNPPSTLTVPTPARTLGIITHTLLEWLCVNTPKSLEEIPWDLSLPELKMLNLSEAAFQMATIQIKAWVTHFFEHPRGQWIMQNHAHAHSEYELLVFENHRMNTRVIDRVFEDNGICWIIDFKTGEQNTKAYQKQLNRYASYMAHHTRYPIRCGLYYLEDAHWVEWAWASSPKYATIPEFY